MPGRCYLPSFLIISIVSQKWTFRNACMLYIQSEYLCSDVTHEKTKWQGLREVRQLICHLMAGGGRVWIQTCWALTLCCRHLYSHNLRLVCFHLEVQKAQLGSTVRWDWEQGDLPCDILRKLVRMREDLSPPILALQWRGGSPLCLPWEHLDWPHRTLNSYLCHTGPLDSHPFLSLLHSSLTPQIPPLCPLELEAISNPLQPHVLFSVLFACLSGFFLKNPGFTPILHGPVAWRWVGAFLFLFAVSSLFSFTLPMSSECSTQCTSCGWHLLSPRSPWQSLKIIASGSLSLASTVLILSDVNSMWMTLPIPWPFFFLISLLQWLSPPLHDYHSCHRRTLDLFITNNCNHDPHNQYQGSPSLATIWVISSTILIPVFPCPLYPLCLSYSLTYFSPALQYCILLANPTLVNPTFCPFCLKPVQLTAVRKLEKTHSPSAWFHWDSWPLTSDGSFMLPSYPTVLFQSTQTLILQDADLKLHTPSPLC